MDHKLTRKPSPSAKPRRSNVARQKSSAGSLGGRSLPGGGHGFSSDINARASKRALAPEARGSGSVSEPQITFTQQMRDFLRRNATWFFVAGFVFLVLQDVFGAHGLVAMRRSQKEAAAVEKEIQQLNDENQQLQNRVQSLRSDPSAIERIAREEMGLARPGEYIFKVQPESGEPSTPFTRPPEPPPSQPARPKKR